MYLERKIDNWLVEWKNRQDKSPALIVGIRQCGKTESINHFGATHYKKVVKINFWDNPEYTHDFDNELDVDSIISNISLRFPNTLIDPKDTLIFFDEIQECPRARLSFKNFKIDGRYDVIGSGSYMGINGYVVGDSTPAPTGYDEVYHMHTMDFEEFLWANGYSKTQILDLEDHFRRRFSPSDSVHTIYKKLYLKYACVGGFPQAVRSYLENSFNIGEAVRITQNVIFDMKSDFGRRKGKDGAP